jgi:hypothetical protein
MMVPIRLEDDRASGWQGQGRSGVPDKQKNPAKSPASFIQSQSGRVNSVRVLARLGLGEPPPPMAPESLDQVHDAPSHPAVHFSSVHMVHLGRSGLS